MLISGPLNDDDVRELAETLRCIERRDPEKHYNIVVTDLDHEPAMSRCATSRRPA